MTGAAFDGRQKTSWLVVPAFAVHTFLVYFLATNLSPILVGRWFAWALPAIQFHTVISPRDWYLQNLELITILPALIGGYINLPRFVPTVVAGQIREVLPGGAWAWIIPTLVLLYKMAAYGAPSSVFYSGSHSAFKYFFQIVPHMPRWEEIVQGNLGADPVRISAQLFVTAPFYAGVSYSVGALASKYEVIQKLRFLGRPKDVASVSEVVGAPKPAPPSFSPD
jgi:hypothetical protein